MPNELLNSFLRDAVPRVGLEHGTHFVYPLAAFLALTSDDPCIQPLIARGLTQEGVRTELSTILSNDLVLTNYCRSIEQLAKALDILFFRKLSLYAYPESPQGLGFGGDPVDLALAELNHQLYEGEAFKKTVYFHLFNLFHDGPLSLSPPYERSKILQLEPTSVPRLLGEQGFHSFLSPPHCGTLFLAYEDSEGFGAETMEAWLARRWNDATPYRQAIQYAIDGIVDIDYLTPHFTPEWLNEIHRPGLYYWGAPRRDQAPFHLRRPVNPQDQQKINNMWRTYLRHRDKIAARGQTLRKAIRIAGDFFEDSHRKINRAEQLANLIIALEALYTTGQQSEQTYRISQHCALLTCEEPSKCKDVFQFLKEMFSRRGKLFHGHYDALETGDGLASDQEIFTLMSIVRQSILRYLALYLAGENNLEDVRKRLQDAIFDQGIRGELLAEANPATFFAADTSG